MDSRRRSEASDQTTRQKEKTGCWQIRIFLLPPKNHEWDNFLSLPTGIFLYLILELYANRFFIVERSKDFDIQYRVNRCLSWNSQCAWCNKSGTRFLCSCRRRWSFCGLRFCRFAMIRKTFLLFNPTLNTYKSSTLRSQPKRLSWHSMGKDLEGSVCRLKFQTTRVA